jgi:hypothetical protein
MYRLVFDLVKAFYIICVVMIYSVSNSNISGFAFLYSSLFWESNRFFGFVLRFDRFFGIL